MQAKHFVMFKQQRNLFDTSVMHLMVLLLLMHCLLLLSLFVWVLCYVHVLLFTTYVVPL